MKGHMTMSDSHTALEQSRTTNDDDGWNDAAAEEAGRFIRGTIMKFVDWRYYAGKQGERLRRQAARPMEKYTAGLLRPSRVGCSLHLQHVERRRPQRRE
jgi:hypothetical protein